MKIFLVFFPGNHVGVVFLTLNRLCFLMGGADASIVARNPLYLN